MCGSRALAGYGSGGSVCAMVTPLDVDRPPRVGRGTNVRRSEARTSAGFGALEGSAEGRDSAPKPTAVRPWAFPGGSSHHAFEQELELPHLRHHGVVGLGLVVDVHRQGPLVV